MKENLQKLHGFAAKPLHMSHILLAKHVINAKQNHYTCNEIYINLKKKKKF